MIAIIAIMLFVLMPAIAIPFIVFGLIKSEKMRPLFLLLIAIFMGLIAYNFVPTIEDDLFRHQIDVYNYSHMSFSSFVEYLFTGTEQISVAYKYIIGLTGNYDLLQFFTTVITYSILFYILYDSTKRYGAGASKSIPVWIFVISCFNFIGISGNIFSYLALELFSLGLYLRYIHNKKIAVYVFSILAILIHTSSIFMFTLFIIFRIFKEKITVKNTIILVVLIALINAIVGALGAYSDVPVVSELLLYYKYYFNNEEYWSFVHSTRNILLYMSKLVIMPICYVVTKKNNGLCGFSLFVAVAICVLFFQTSFSIRYIPVALLCGVPLMFEAINSKRGKYVVWSLLLLSAPQVVYQILQIANRNFGNTWLLMTNDFITTLSGGSK